MYVLGWLEPYICDMRYIYGNFVREIIKYTVIYNAYIHIYSSDLPYVCVKGGESRWSGGCSGVSVQRE